MNVLYTVCLSVRLLFLSVRFRSVIVALPGLPIRFGSDSGQSSGRT